MPRRGLCARDCKADGNSRALREAMSRGALLFTDETVVRLEPETDGLRVISREGGPAATAGAERSRVTRAVILAAGAMNTPLILARSTRALARRNAAAAPGSRADVPHFRHLRPARAR